MTIEGINVLFPSRSQGFSFHRMISRLICSSQCMFLFLFSKSAFTLYTSRSLIS